MTHKTKLFGLSVLMLFTVIVVSASSSAASLTITNVNYPATVEHNAGSFPISFDIRNTGAADPAISFVLQMLSGQATLTMSNVAIADGSETPVTIHVSGTLTFQPNQAGFLNGTITVDDQGGGSPKLVPFNVDINEAAAAPSLVIRRLQDVTQRTNGSIEVENNGNVAFTNVVLTDSGSLDVRFLDSSGTQVSSFSLTAGQRRTFTVAPVSLGTVGFGGVSTQITASSGSTTSNALAMAITGSFCQFGEVGHNLEIRDVKIDNTGDGKDDEWHLLDTVEIEVEVENNGNDDVDDVFVELGFFDSDGNNQVSDLDFDNTDEEEYDVGSIGDSDKETATFKFKVPADFEDGNYKLTVKAYSDDVGEEAECTDTATDFDHDDKYTVIDLQREDDEGKFIAFDNIEFTPTEATCGDRIGMHLDVYNIGDEDQDQVKITLQNSELALNQFIEIRNDLDQGDKESISFDFVVPQNAQDKFYTLKLSSDYDYRSGTYRESSDEDTDVQFRVIGCGGGSTGGNTGGNGGSGDNIAVISATLQSDEAVAGEKVIVKATVTNLQSQRAALAVDATGYQSWASLDEISPRIVDLPSGQSQDVLLTFTLDEDAEGEQSFDVQVKDGAGNIETREIALNVEGSSTGGSGGFDFGDNSFLWIIGAVNVILVILIIVVAVRVARR